VAAPATAQNSAAQTRSGATSTGNFFPIETNSCRGYKPLTGLITKKRKWSVGEGFKRTISGYTTQKNCREHKQQRGILSSSYQFVCPAHPMQKPPGSMQSIECMYVRGSLVRCEMRRHQMRNNRCNNVDTYTCGRA